jgi:hypothetical protein
LTKLREDLINIAFLLEPQVDDLLTDYKDQDLRRYAQEHEENDTYYEKVIDSDKDKFASHYANFKESVVRFHKLKQEDAINKALARLNSGEFVNPKTRIKIFEEMREEQMKLFDQRSEIIKQMEASRPTSLNKNFI